MGVLENGFHLLDARPAAARARADGRTTTGRYATRQELVGHVWLLWLQGHQEPAALARELDISEAALQRILDSREGYPVRPTPQRGRTPLGSLRPGRLLVTGRFDTQQQLHRVIWALWFVHRWPVADIASNTEVSEAHVHTTLRTRSGAPPSALVWTLPHLAVFRELATLEQPTQVLQSLWLLRLQHQADERRIARELALPLHLVSAVIALNVGNAFRKGRGLKTQSPRVCGKFATRDELEAEVRRLRLAEKVPAPSIGVLTGVSTREVYRILRGE